MAPHYLPYQRDSDLPTGQATAIELLCTPEGPWHIPLVDLHRWASRPIKPETSHGIRWWVEPKLETRVHGADLTNFAPNLA
jgi:hypothetical protein